MISYKKSSKKNQSINENFQLPQSFNFLKIVFLIKKNIKIIINRKPALLFNNTAWEWQDFLVILFSKPVSIFRVKLHDALLSALKL